MNYRGLELDHFQRHAIEAIQRGRSVIVSAPTGTGKTLIADYLIEQILKEGGEVIYTSPIKALSNQKYRQYVRTFGEENVGLVTGDLVIRRDAPLRIMTTEILRNILLEGRHDPNLVEEDEVDEDQERGTRSPADADIPDLRQLRAVIVDEIHFLDDPDRGTVWEELLIYLPHDIRILGLSATLSNLDEFTAWLNQVRRTEFELIYEPKRAVPLRFFMMSNETGLLPIDKYNKQYANWRRSNGSKRQNDRRGGNNRRRGPKRDDEKSTRHLDVLESLHPHSFPALYFIFSRALVERLANELSRSRTGRTLASPQLVSRIEEVITRFEHDNPGVLPDRLKSMYRRGIAFHHAGLHVALKGLVEELYEAGLIRVLYCTSTFALGINMPARTVIFDSLTKYDGTAISPLTVREFMQMAGRAGRRGLDVEGDIVIRQDFRDYEEVQPLLKRLFDGESEPVTSSFNLAFHAVVNLLARFDEEDIRALLEQSFKAWRSRQAAGELRLQIERKQELLGAQAPSDRDHPRDRLMRHRRQLTSLRRQLVEEERPRLWEDFYRKVEFLRAHGYIAPDNELLSPALVLKKIKMEEIFLTELVMQGALEDLEPAELYGVMCGLVQTLPRNARVRRPPEKWDAIISQIVRVYQSDTVQGAAQLTESEVVLTPELMALGERWAKGESLTNLMQEIDSPTDLSGDLVGALRRAKDLISQLRAVFEEDAYRRRELTQLMRLVTRDEVEAVF